MPMRKGNMHGGGYIYEYNGKVYTIEYVEKDMSLKFDFLNGVVSNITISIK